jgi:threonyl-tRNA synthetase
MKGLILHCKNFSFKDIENSTKPDGISVNLNDRQLTQGDYKEQVVILTCIEEVDNEQVIDRAVDHVNHMVLEWHKANRNVLVTPFAHLSRDIAKPPKSKDLMHDFVHKLQESGNKVELVTFGSHKEWMIDVYGYPRATSWFQFP